MSTLGRGLRVDDGDLAFEQGRLVEVTGIANLTQALTLRLLTPLGSDRFNTRYGLDLSRVFSEPSGIRTVKELLKLNVVGTLGTDPRVQEVRTVTIDDDPERLIGDGGDAARLRDIRHSRVWTVRAEVLAVAADQTVTLVTNVEV
jgi:phage baseplate assembly protein W